MCYLIGMAARTLHPSRFAILVVLLGLMAAGCTSTPENSSPTDSTLSTLATSPAQSSTTTETATPGQLGLGASIPEGRSVIIPEGPYVPGQQVNLLFRDDVAVDLLNGSPRLCAQINDGDEVCDPSLLQTQVLSDAPTGTQGVTVEVPQRHFGPAGERDCGDVTMQCRLIWMSEAGQALASPDLTYSSALDPSPLIVEVMVGPEVGAAAIRIQKLDSIDLTEFLTPQRLEEIEDSVNLSGRFNREQLELTLAVGALCGFGVGGPPIGSEDLLESPSWWPTTTPHPLSYRINCDWLAVEGDLGSEGGDWANFRVKRDIYGFGGWQDCAIETCYLEAVVRWTHPLPGGSKLGEEITASRVLIDIPDTWPSSRPSVSILEPGPYKPGQEVTVEVRNYPYGSSELDIGWCPGDEYTCYYRSTTWTAIGDLYRVTLMIPRSADGCGLNRCYFAIDSPSEGMAPPAVVVVPVLD